MNGAESLVRTLLAGGIDTCFANPGTSEMHFVAALDRVEGMRCVLGLAETVVAGCADGYARMAGRPAATLLHCGPGFANAISNVHNARRANSPMVNIVGDHATYHHPLDPPLAADTEGLARATSHWMRRSTSAANVGADGAAAVQAARTPPGRIATLILPADASWSEGGVIAQPLAVPERKRVASERIEAIARVLRSGERAILILSGPSLGEKGLAAAELVSRRSGAGLRTPMQVPRMARGRGRPRVDRIPYAVDKAIETFAGVRHVIRVAAPSPVAFFAYPGKPGLLAPADSIEHVLAATDEDAVGALEELAEMLGKTSGKGDRLVDALPLPRLRENIAGSFEPVAFAHLFAGLIPENAIVMEEAVTSGRALFAPTFDAAPHDWLQITGGAIGQGLPCATGAAIGAPGRKVICLEADGSGMYSLQALWTQARERLDVVNVIFANRAYRILQGEMQAVEATPGRASAELFDLGRPALDWVKLAGGMGVEGARVRDLAGFADAFKAACARSGPFLIEFET